MAGSIPSSKDSKARPASQSEGPRKKHKATPPDFSDSNSLVTFIVVENKGRKKTETKFTVHKEVACYHSTVWRAAFKSNFIEGQTQTYQLEDTTSRAFKLLVQWLYSQRIQVRQLDNDWVRNNAISESKDEDYALLELWVLADRISNAKLQNCTLDKIDQIWRKHHTIATQTLNYVYTHTSSDSSLRKYFVKTYACGLEPAGFKHLGHHLPNKMLIDLAIFHAKQRHIGVDIDLSEFLVPIEEEAKNGGS
ncbi:hypothetical protein LSUB1_G007683 [Lachnellula subtilissima]|uniref:BTB domain-containing protein n=1 Tax=Lachnellula subtilissima TaxID=602034 RepID=A0A8H8U7E6_9HELO|nr:hypothetical protein LSUB1_G007683 [Lachnellula subtilissima]